MNNNLNQTLQNIINFYDRGINPNEIMQSMISQNPNIMQLSTQYQNITQGKNIKDVLMQLAKQNGVSESTLQGLARILGAKK